MDYQVNAHYKTAATLGFRGNGQLEITSKTLRITGRRPTLYEQLALYPLTACFIVLIVLLYLWPDEAGAILGHTGYWSAVGATGISLCLTLWAVRERKHTAVFPLSQLQQVILQDTNITIIVRNDQDEESTLTAHYVTPAITRAIVNALDKRHPITTPITFGYDVQPNMLVVNRKGMLSLTDRKLVFSNLRRSKDPSTSGLLTTIATVMLMNLLQHWLPASANSRAISFVIAAAVIFIVAIYLPRRRHPYTFSYQQILNFVPQGSIMLLKARDAIGNNQSILFRLTDPTQMPTLLAELQERTSNKVNPSSP